MSKINKKLTAVISAVLCICIIFSFAACSASKETINDNNKKLNIVCTIFPEYDWVKQILGDKAENADITMLLDNGVDLHSYQPTADDIIKISDCDMFIYVGGESDEWVEDALKNATNKNMVVINLLEVLGDSVKTEEIVEGMQEEEHHHHDEENADEDAHEHHDEEGAGEDAHEHEEEADEHVWLSLRNAESICKIISEKLAEIDPENKDTYAANTTAYIEKLSALDNEYKDMVKNARYKTVLFGDRFPFRYLVDDYGLSYYAAFVGCSAETEASFETITFLANKVDELQLPAVLTIEGTDHSIAKTIVDNTKTKDQEILSLDSMQSTTSEDVKNGVTYLSVMQSNLNVLEKALG